jgi:hypothetical protein
MQLDAHRPPSAISQMLLQLNRGAQMKTGQCALLCAPLPQPPSILYHNPPIQYNYGLFVLSTCLHPSSPTWAEEGRHTNPSSFILTCPSLSDTLLTYYSPSSHLICHLARIFRWPSTLACHLYIYLFSCYTVPSSIHNGAK